MKELIKQALISIIGKSTGVYGLLINYLTDFIYKWSDILIGKEIDKLKGKKQAKDIKNAKKPSDITDSFDNLD